MPTNSEIVGTFYSCMSRGDVPGALALLGPETTWTEAEGFPYGGTFRGPEQVLANVFMKLGTEWDGFAGVPQQFVSEGETVVVLGQYSGTYKATQKKFSAPFAHIWTVKNGKVTAFRQLTDTALALRAINK